MKQPSQISRRTLLKQAATAGVGVMALPHIVPSSVFGATAPSNKLNIGILACGGRARDGMNACAGSENIVAICGVDQRSIAEAKKELAKRGMADKAKVYEDYRKLLDEEKALDAVLIAPGQRWHTAMSKRAMLAGKHVFCEKPLAHSCAQAHELRELAKQCPKIVTQTGSQGGSTDTFRRSMEVIQAGVLGQIREVHVWMDRGCPPSQSIDTHADAIPKELNWDFWCGPSRLLPFKSYYLGYCLQWGPWLEFGDGHLADMGAHGLNLPWRALKLAAPLSCTTKVPEPVKDSYPSATDICWDFAARGDLPAVKLWWHDGGKGPPAELGNELISTYNRVPGNGVLFAGDKGILCSDCWGVGGVVKLKGEARCRGVQDHAACKPVPVTLPRVPGQFHVGEWLTACKGGPKTFQGFETGARVAEIAMVGMLAIRFKAGVKAPATIEWDSEALKVKGAPEADAIVHMPMRQKWL
jgi:hypothetical protein